MKLTIFAFATLYWTYFAVAGISVPHVYVVACGCLALISALKCLDLIWEDREEKKESCADRSPKKTITLGHGDDPEVSICLGHVDAKTFGQAFCAEGWDGRDENGDHGFRDEDLSREWWVERVNGNWEKSEQGAPGAVPVTVSTW